MGTCDTRRPALRTRFLTLVTRRLATSPALAALAALAARRLALLYPPSSIALSCYPPSCTSCTCSTSGPPTIARCTCTSLALSTAQLHLQHGAALYSPAVRMRLPLRPAPDTPRPLRRLWAAAAY